MMRRPCHDRWLASLGLALVWGLSGCSDGGPEDLQQWMREQRAQVKATVPPLPEPKKFSPQAYLGAGALDPFSRERLAQALRAQGGNAASNAALVAPELNRRKEPLESVPLDAMKMVGSLNRNGQPVALIKVDNLIYQVRPGNYLGLNYGKIVKITETEVVLREIVQDAAGEWIERQATLQLQEGMK
ncbi:type IV pilus assembly protein PilP [Tibeticola sediminis]|jgi:type IV pilus assembly protein PilP|uniref:Type IV pilus assembly protein PilP n=2 Tax=Comamonadaceae TaxID=80864 RepID=A0A3N4UCK2_9BURK|nr:type IV pilus assembly protein PilP [Tibeticola sediminis]